jgi:hypothetical protein
LITATQREFTRPSVVRQTKFYAEENYTIGHFKNYDIRAIYTLPSTEVQIPLKGARLA